MTIIMPITSMNVQIMHMSVPIMPIVMPIMAMTVRMIMPIFLAFA